MTFFLYDSCICGNNTFYSKGVLVLTNRVWAGLCFSTSEPITAGMWISFQKVGYMDRFHLMLTNYIKCVQTKIAYTWHDLTIGPIYVTHDKYLLLHALTNEKHMNSVYAKRPINLFRAKCFGRNHKYIFTCHGIPPHWNATGSWKLTSCKTRTYSST